LNEHNSLFRLREYLQSPVEGKTRRKRVKAILNSFVPSLTKNWVAARNYSKLADLLREKNRSTSVLVVGAGELGVGTAELISEEGIKVVQTDVQLGPRIAVVADGHDLPFVNGSFDAVVAQAVLEHVIDPYRCVAELHRVLKPSGFVYAETPFLYPVHMGPYDFTRFSMNGHRRLFRYFWQIDSNMASGSGTALAVSIRSYVLCFSSAPVFSKIVKTFLPFLR
jgi:SAM-dependent methyltransferase